ncbi:hypothetical protein BDV26DRAFT_197186 [Aspergillus bertholletiae]|uniref:Uncharacterized protein n=1 Tax=Aspergillus bertholletiae TaxID=1226010 RepID=A0A5N7BNF6_9EURO|nr:hypothetical protein BDV26DRAFT_197186 [Aspergillus bertholletiae]
MRVVLLKLPPYPISNLLFLLISHVSASHRASLPTRSALSNEIVLTFSNNPTRFIYSAITPVIAAMIGVIAPGRLSPVARPHAI